MNPEALPNNLRRRILVCDAPHSSLGSPCWMWTGRLNRNGYGRAWHRGAEPVAHRAVYEELVGPVPPGHLLDHLCTHRSCCNPAHLEPVVPAENVRRGGAVLFRPAALSVERAPIALPEPYAAFLATKAPVARPTGIAEVTGLNPALTPLQAHSTGFGLRQGTFGLFLDTGLGKTLVELEWSRRAAAATNGCALILSPLAVAPQIVREGRKFGYEEAWVIRDASAVRPGINVCNYDLLDKLDPSAFGSVALDESSILKSFTGKTTRALIDAFRRHPFRLAATATPAPNDHMELGQHAEFLGVMPSNEMLMRWFTADQAQMGRYRLKRHGETSFWDWMASWAVMAETPADLGFPADGYELPPLRIHRHKAAGDVRAPAGALFAVELSATEMHETKRQTAEARAALAAQIVSGMPPDEPAVLWCDTDYEADALRERIAGAAEVRGSHTPVRKEHVLGEFSAGREHRLITKPSIAGFGMNWQHCATMIFVGRSFSYEAWYQAIRRCWRFGQLRPVDCHLIVAEGEEQIGRVIERKGADHARMKASMAAAMRRARSADAHLRVPYSPNHTAEVPTWLRSAA